MIFKALQLVGGMASTWIESKAESQKLNLEIKKKQLTGDIDWDLEAMKGSQSSWKDEYFVIILSLPLILCWIPAAEGWVERGFEQLNKAPDWYFYSLGIAISASFGVRGATAFFKRNK